MVTCTVACPGPWPAACPWAGPEPLPGAADATGETAVTVPGAVVTPSGSVTVTSSPARTRYSWLTGTWASTTGAVDVAVSTPVPGCGGAPGTAVTAVTRSAPGA